MLNLNLYCIFDDLFFQPYHSQGGTVGPPLSTFIANVLLTEISTTTPDGFQVEGTDIAYKSQMFHLLSIF